MSVELMLISMTGGSWERRIIAKCRHEMPDGFFNRMTLFSPGLDVPGTNDFVHIKTLFLPAKGDQRYLYNVWKLRELPRYVQADHVLLASDDGFILHGSKWRAKWLDYDYIGAPWDAHSDGGNSGFSLQSARLMRWYSAHPLTVDTEPPWFNNDSHICRRLYNDAIADGFKFAPFEEELVFSLEIHLPDFPRTPNDVFGFHGKETLNELSETDRPGTL